MSNLFTLPFQRGVWLAIGLLILLLLVLLYVAMVWEWKQISSMEEQDKNYNLRPGYEIDKPSLSEDMLVILGAASQQGMIENI